jgi:hypothetical protein
MGVLIKSDNENAGEIYIGDSYVLTTTGIKLIHDDWISVESADITNIYAIASMNSQKLYYMGV